MRKEYNAIQGSTGEFDARKYLESKKYKIILQNYKNRIGEIDIIAMQKKTIVFIEVKKRSTYSFGRPSEAVNKTKQQKIRNTAIIYLSANKLTNCECRFDVIEVVDKDINHIENAF